MNPRQHAIIADLLVKREARFVRVWECEQAVNTILGTSYPFPDPPPLPSRTRKAPRPKKKTKQSISLRRLQDPRENAYRIHFLREGHPDTSIQPSTRHVRALANLPPDLFRLLRVETVTLEENGTVTLRDVLWETGEFHEDQSDSNATG